MTDKGYMLGAIGICAAIGLCAVLLFLVAEGVLYLSAQAKRRQIKRRNDALWHDWALYKAELRDGNRYWMGVVEQERQERRRRCEYLRPADPAEFPAD